MQLKLFMKVKKSLHIRGKNISCEKRKDISARHIQRKENFLNEFLK